MSNVTIDHRGSHIPRLAPVLPFTIVRDSNESAPYHFAGINSDSEQRCNGLPWVVPIKTAALWAMSRVEIVIDAMPHMKGLADYTIEGHELSVQIERKSLADLYGTLGQRRRDFEAEICRLNQCQFAAVVIESDWPGILNPDCPSRLSPKAVSRTILSWSVRYPRVHWFTCSGRRHAELTTFQLLRQFWKSVNEQ